MYRGDLPEAADRLVARLSAGDAAVSVDGEQGGEDLVLGLFTSSTSPRIRYHEGATPGVREVARALGDGSGWRVLPMYVPAIRSRKNLPGASQGPAVRMEVPRQLRPDHVVARIEAGLRSLWADAGARREGQPPLGAWTGSRAEAEGAEPDEEAAGDRGDMPAEGADWDAEQPEAGAERRDPGAWVTAEGHVLADVDGLSPEADASGWPWAGAAGAEGNGQLTGGEAGEETTFLDLSADGEVAERGGAASGGALEPPGAEQGQGEAEAAALDVTDMRWSQAEVGPTAPASDERHGEWGTSAADVAAEEAGVGEDPWGGTLFGGGATQDAGETGGEGTPAADADRPGAGWYSPAHPAAGPARTPTDVGSTAGGGLSASPLSLAMALIECWQRSQRWAGPTPSWPVAPPSDEARVRPAAGGPPTASWPWEEDDVLAGEGAGGNDQPTAEEIEAGDGTGRLADGEGPSWGTRCADPDGDAEAAPEDDSRPACDAGLSVGRGEEPSCESDAAGDTVDGQGRPAMPVSIPTLPDRAARGPGRVERVASAQGSSVLPPGFGPFGIGRQREDDAARPSPDSEPGGAAAQGPDASRSDIVADAADRRDHPAGASVRTLAAAPAPDQADEKSSSAASGPSQTPRADADASAARPLATSPTPVEGQPPHPVVESTVMRPTVTLMPAPLPPGALPGAAHPFRRTAMPAAAAAGARTGSFGQTPWDRAAATGASVAGPSVAVSTTNAPLAPSEPAGATESQVVDPPRAADSAGSTGAMESGTAAWLTATRPSPVNRPVPTEAHGWPVRGPVPGRLMAPAAPGWPPSGDSAFTPRPGGGWLPAVAPKVGPPGPNARRLAEAHILVPFR